MTKQEEIKRYVDFIIRGDIAIAQPSSVITKHVLDYLHSQGLKLPDGESLIEENQGKTQPGSN